MTVSAASFLESNMSVSAIAAQHTIPGTKLALNLPTWKGCGFECKWCWYIGENPVPSKREIMSSSMLTPGFYRKLIWYYHELCKNRLGYFPLNGISINGAQAFGDIYSSMLSKCIIEESTRLQIQKALISSGTGIPDNIDLLAEHGVLTYITLWDGDCIENDLLRQATDADVSAYDTALFALEHLVGEKRMRGLIRVATSFMPGEVERALRVMRLLPEHIRTQVTFVFEPMLRVMGQNSGKPYHTAPKFIADAKLLIAEAQRLGLSMLLDDEQCLFDLEDHVDPSFVINRRDDFIVRVHQNGVVQDHFQLFRRQHDGDVAFDEYRINVQEAGLLEHRI